MTTGDRHAALLLHAAHPIDREWLLNRLPDDARTRLVSLLDELTQLGIPPDAAMMAQAGAANDASIESALADRFPSATSDDDFHACRVTEACCPSIVAHLLHDVPSRFIADVLHCHAWPWHEAYLDGLAKVSPTQRKAVEKIRAGMLRATAADVANVSFSAISDATTRGARRAAVVRSVVSRAIAAQLANDSLEHVARGHVAHGEASTKSDMHADRNADTSADGAKSAVSMTHGHTRGDRFGDMHGNASAGSLRNRLQRWWGRR